MEQTTAPAVIEPEKFGLSVEKAQTISQAFTAKIAESDTLSGVFSEIIKKEITPEISKQAGDLRKKAVKIRTGIASIHKSEKAFHLAAGRFVDAWKNKLTTPIEQMEETLISIEKHAEIEAAKKIQAIQAEREKIIRPYVENLPDMDFGNMPADVWEPYLKAKKDAHAAKVAADQKAAQEETERKAREAKEREALEAENKRLREEKEAADAKAAKAEKDRETSENNAQAVEKELTRLKTEAEARTAQPAPISISADIGSGESVSADYKAPEMTQDEKFVALLKDLEDLKKKYTFTSMLGSRLARNIFKLIDKIIVYANTELTKMKSNAGTKQPTR